MASAVVLVTGATGVVGSALVDELLRQRDTKVLLLLRSRQGQTVEQRLQSLSRRWGENDETPARESNTRVSAIPGDVTAPRLGMADDDFRYATEQVTHIAHCAGDVRMNLDLHSARRVAVDSMREVLKFCAIANTHGQLQKLDVVSTVGVAGKLDRLVEERRLTESRSFHSTYEQAKAEAEDVLFDAAPTGVPLTVHRPTMVVGDSRTGRIASFQLFYYLAEFASGGMTHGLVPRLTGLRLDVVPCDYVARAIACSLFHITDRATTVLHLGLGGSRALEFANFAELSRSTARRCGKPRPRLKWLPEAQFRLILPIMRKLPPFRRHRFLGSLELFLDHAAERQLFDTSRTEQLLAEHGITIAEPCAFVPRVLAQYWGGPVADDVEQRQIS